MTWQKKIFAFMLNLIVYVLFGTKIFDLVKNDVHNGENQPHPEVGDRHVGLDNQSLKLYALFILDFCTFLEVMYVCHNIKSLKKCTYFSY